MFYTVEVTVRLCSISLGSRYKFLCCVSQAFKPPEICPNVLGCLGKNFTGTENKFFVGHNGRNTEMLAQKFENFCASTDFCVPITIGLRWEHTLYGQQHSVAIVFR